MPPPRWNPMGQNKTLLHREILLQKLVFAAWARRKKYTTLKHWQTCRFHYFSFRFVSVSKISYWVVCFQEIIIFWKKIVVGCFIHPYRHISFTENTLVKENRTRLDTKFKGINCTYSQLITSIYTFNSENFTLYLQFSLECVFMIP
jgi:hypothetical protein